MEGILLKIVGELIFAIVVTTVESDFRKSSIENRQLKGDPQ